MLHRGVVGALLVVAGALAVPLAAPQSGSNQGPTCSARAQVRNERSVSGPRAAAHAKQMLKRSTGKHLQRAFAKLKRERGVTIDFGAAWGLVGRVSPAPAVNPASLRPSGPAQPHVVLAAGRSQWSMSDDNVEILFIPAVSEEGYWLGTLVATHYDDGGQADCQEIFNLELQYNQPTEAGWAATYEDPIYMGDPRTEEPPSTIMTLGAVPPPTVRHIAMSTRRTVPTQIRSVGFKWLGRAASWVACGGTWCAGAAAGCALGHWWNAELAWAPCTGAGCAGGFIGCTYGTLWEWQ